MKLMISKECADWFNEEMGLRPGAGIRFKSKIYASSPINESFGLSIEAVEPDKPAVTYLAENGLLFFIEEEDEWFFDGHDLEVTLDSLKHEPHYRYYKNNQMKQ